LAVLGVTVVTGEIVLQIHLKVAMLCTVLAQESVRNVTLLGAVSDDLLFRGSYVRENLSV
jgi:hypothetical protein